MSLFNGPKPLRVRLTYRFRIAYIKMLEARERGEEYDFLKDRDLMLNQKDVENYINDLKILREHGESLMPFAFAREFLHDESLPSFEEIYEDFKRNYGNNIDLNS